MPVLKTPPPPAASSTNTRPDLKRDVSYDNSSLPAPLGHAFPYLTPKQQVLTKLLCSSILGQSHLFEDWPLDTHLEAKVDCIQQLEALNEACPCGLVGFVISAKDRLQVQQQRQLGSVEKTVELDMKQLGNVGFVLVDDDDGNKDVR